MATATAPTINAPKIRQTECFIGGQWIPAVSGKTFDTINPATEEVIAQVAEGDAADIDLAVKAARKAFEHGPWSQDGCPRSRPADEQAGRPDRRRRSTNWPRSNRSTTASRSATRKAADLPLTIDCLRYYAGYADKIHGQTIPVRGNYFTYTRREPVGVVGQIIPWNFPMLMVGLEVGPGPGRRLHDRDEAGRANAADLPADGPAGAEGRHSRRRDQRRSRLRPDGRRRAREASAASTRSPSPASTERRRSSCATPRRR